MAVSISVYAALIIGGVVFWEILKRLIRVLRKKLSRAYRVHRTMSLRKRRTQERERKKVEKQFSSWLDYVLDKSTSAIEIVIGELAQSVVRYRDSDNWKRRDAERLEVWGYKNLLEVLHYREMGWKDAEAIYAKGLRERLESLAALALEYGGITHKDLRYWNEVNPA